MAKKPQIFKCNSKRIISIGEEKVSSEIFMSIRFILLDTLKNLNNIQYSPEFLQEVADNQQKYISLPLMAEFNKLAKGKTSNLTHAYNKNTGVFSSQMIGSFISFETQANADDETILELVGEARVPKRFTDICEVLQELFDSGNLTLSYEIIAGECSKEGTTTFVDVSEYNYLFAMACVTNPAVLSAHSLTLVAQIMEGNIEGGENLQRNKESFTVENMFENSKINLAELDINQVKTKLFNQLRETMEDNYWMYDSQDIGVDYVVLKNYSTADLIKVEFSVANNEVTILDTYNVDKTYIRKNNEEELKMAKTLAELEIEIAAKEAVIKDKDQELEKTKKDAKSKDEEKEKEVAAAKDETKAKCAEIATMTEQLNVLSASIIAKDIEIAELAPIKTAYELAEVTKVAEKLAADKVALREKFSKVLSAEVVVEMAEAFENLDETKLNSKVVEIAMASAIKVPDTKPNISLASRITDTVKIAGVEPGSLREKYSI